MTLNGTLVHLPKSVIIPLRDKFRLRHIIRKRSLLLHVILTQGTSWYALDSKEYLLPPPCLDDSDMLLQKMASDMIAAQHNCEGLKFILPDDTETADLEVMTLTGIHIYRKDRNCSKKNFLSWSKENTPPPTFLRKVQETKGERSKEILESILDQDLEPNFRPKPPYKCPKLAKLSDRQITQDTNKCKTPISNNKQTTNDKIPSTVRKMQSQAQKMA